MLSLQWSVRTKLSAAAILAVVVVVAFVGSDDGRVGRVSGSSGVAENAVPAPLAPEHAEARCSGTSPSDQPSPAFGNVVTGRLITSRRIPVARATVVALLDGHEASRGESGPDGRFSLSLSSNPSLPVQIRAHHAASGTGGRRVIGPRRESFDLGAILMLRDRRVRVRVCAEERLLAGARVSIYGDSECLFPVAEHAATDGRGEVVLDCLPPCPLTVLAAASGWASARVTIDAAATEVGVSLAPESVVRVRLVDGITRAPLAGALLTPLRVEDAMGGSISNVGAPGAAVASTTDERGETLVRGLAQGERVALQSTDLKGYSRRLRTPVTIVGGDEQVAVLEAEPLRVCRWRIVHGGDAAWPEEGCALSVRAAGSEPDTVRHASGRIEGDTAVVEGLDAMGVQMFLVTEGGGIALARADARATEGEAISFWRSRSVRVAMESPHGEPIPGMALTLMLAGAFEIVARRTTNASGIVEFNNVFPFGHASSDPNKMTFERIVVQCVPFFPSEDTTRDVATIELREASVEVCVALPDEELFLLSVTLDGVPGLPAAYYLSSTGVVSSVPVREDPERGEIMLRGRRLAQGSRVLVRIVAGGFRPQMVDVTSGRGDVALVRY